MNDHSNIADIEHKKTPFPLDSKEEKGFDPVSKSKVLANA